jgi:DNA-binding NtrC family response regulator
VEASDLELLARLEAGEPQGSALPSPGSMTLEEVERAMISNCMRHYDGNVTHAAEALGLSRAALYRRLEKYGLAEDG